MDLNNQNLVRLVPETLRPLLRYSNDGLLARLENEVEIRKETQRFSFYQPIRPCAKFIENIGHGNRFIGILSAANGVGKTTLVVNTIANIIWPNQNKNYNYPIFRHWPYPKRIRYITDPKLLEEIGPFHTEIQKWWPKGQYEASKGGHGYYSQYKANGFVVDVMSTQQDREQHEGVTLGAIFSDEPPRRDLWSAMVSRFRLGGILCVLMTPLTEAAWFFDEIVPKHQDSIVYADIEDACIQHGENGHLEHSNIQNMISNMPPDEVEARAHGKAMYLKGLIYKEFDYKIHVNEKDIMPPNGSSIFQYVDPHGDKPFAVIWTHKTPDNRVIIFDEWPHEEFDNQHGSTLTVEDYKRIFTEFEKPWRVERRVIDRHFAEVRSTFNKKTLREEFQSQGLMYWPSYSAQEEVETGILKVHSWLRYDPSKPLGNVNRPTLMINPRCKNTIKGLMRWSRDPETGKPKDLYKDFPDIVRYAAMDNMTTGPKLPEVKYQKARWG